MSKAVIGFGVGSILVGAFLSFYVGPLSALLCGIVGLSLIGYGVMANDEDRRDDLFFDHLGEARKIGLAVEDERQKEAEDQSSWPDVILEC